MDRVAASAKYINYGKGYPGWNASVTIRRADGVILLHASWPQVDGPTVCVGSGVRRRTLIQAKRSWDIVHAWDRARKARKSNRAVSKKTDVS